VEVEAVEVRVAPADREDPRGIRRRPEPHDRGSGAVAERGDLEAFLRCFPIDTHPAVGTQFTVDGANKNTAA